LVCEKIRIRLVQCGCEGLAARRVEVTRQFRVVIERGEDGYLVASVPSLQGCHTQARSMDELIERIKEAIQLCREVQGEETAQELELVGIQRVAV
jgi:predicted RNase H-like HicB family nuclease